MNNDDAWFQKFRSRLNAGGIAILVTIAAATWFFGVRPLNEKIAQAQTELDDQAAFLTGSAATPDKESALFSQLKTAREKRDRVRARIPAQAKPNTFLYQLDELAKQTKFSISDYSPRDVKPAARWSEQFFQVSGAGSYLAVSEFLSGLQSGPRMCRIRSLHVVAPADSNRDNEQLQVTLELSLYFGAVEHVAAAAAGAAR